MPTTPLYNAHQGRFFFYMPIYDKPFLTINEQIELLINRGLHIPNKEEATHYLSNISYYRLSAYMSPLQIKGTEHQFREGKTFKDVIHLYTFDRELRILLLDAIERIEVSIRTQLVHHYSESYSAKWYENPDLFNNKGWLKAHLKSLNKEITRSKEEFIKHHKEKYSTTDLPAWKAFETCSFGLLSKFYDNLKKTPEKKSIASHYKLSPTIVSNWSYVLSNLRNLCAHHSRVWNRAVPATLKLPNDTGVPWVNNDELDGQKLYASLCAIIYLLKTVNPQTSFITLFHQLLDKHSEIDTRAMGFPDGWKNEVLWN